MVLSWDAKLTLMIKHERICDLHQLVAKWDDPSRAFKHISIERDNATGTLTTSEGIMPLVWPDSDGPASWEKEQQKRLSLRATLNVKLLQSAPEELHKLTTKERYNPAPHKTKILLHQIVTLKSTYPSQTLAQNRAMYILEDTVFGHLFQSAARTTLYCQKILTT